MPTPTPKSLPGRWLITSMPDFEDYLELGTERPVLMLKRSEHGSISGEYSFGLSTGEINGELREFGGEKILLFGYNGSDEMDESHGAGWARLAGPNKLEGEFLGYGRFEAKRGKPLKGSGGQGKIRRIRF